MDLKSREDQRLKNENRKLKVAIIGAGPIGLEAAIAAEERGYEVVVFEKGNVAEAVRHWGHVKMFSPLGMNASALGLERLRKRGWKVPANNALLTGREYVEAYLEPL